MTQFAGGLHLFSDGTGKAYLNYFTIFNEFAVAPGPAPIGGGHTECDVSLSTGAQSPGHPDPMITLRYHNCLGADTFGRSIANTQTLGSLYRQAAVAADLNTIVFWQVDPVVEIIQWSTNTGLEHRQRMCTRTGTAVRLLK